MAVTGTVDLQLRADFRTRGGLQLLHARLDASGDASAGEVTWTISVGPHTSRLYYWILEAWFANDVSASVQYYSIMQRGSFNRGHGQLNLPLTDAGYPLAELEPSTNGTVREIAGTKVPVGDADPAHHIPCWLGSVEAAGAGGAAGEIEVRCANVNTIEYYGEVWLARYHEAVVLPELYEYARVL